MRESVRLAWNDVTRVMSTAEQRAGWKRHSPSEVRGRKPPHSIPELARIGTHLRVLYQHLEEEPVAEPLQRLLDRLGDR
jgi:hypothetical protein